MWDPTTPVLVATGCPSMTPTDGHVGHGAACHPATPPVGRVEGLPDAAAHTVTVAPFGCGGDQPEVAGVRWVELADDEARAKRRHAATGDKTDVGGGDASPVGGRQSADGHAHPRKMA